LALLAYMARLGSSLPVEVVTDLEEISASFDLSQFGMAPTKFSSDDLKQHSAKTLRSFDFVDVKDRLTDSGVPTEQAETLWAVLGPNLDRVSDVTDWLDVISKGAEPIVDAEDAEFVTAAFQLLPEQPWTDSTWGEWTSEVKSATGRRGRKLFMPLRKALTGRDHGPDMGALMPLLQGPVPTL